MGSRLAVAVVTIAVCGFFASEVGGSEVQGSRHFGRVFVFTTTDCPIANRYAPEIARLYERFAPLGFAFTLVYANPRESQAVIEDHATRFGYRMPRVRDTAHALVRRFGITVTPEVAVVDAADRVVYRGRIDNRYVEIGVDRQRATEHDLRDALEAVATGRPVPRAHAPAVGCFVSDFQPVTFARDIAPVLYDKCASCHRPGGPAPFSLLSYADVRQRASLIASVTERGFMPPYQGVSATGTFQGQKRLTPEERAMLRAWSDAGAPEGDPATMPTPPRASTAWLLGTPDLVVTTGAPYTLPSDPSDVFRIFVIRLPIRSTTYVRGIEFNPGNARVVHHANIRLDATAGSRELDARDPQPGYDGLLARSAVYPDGHFLGWTPGQVAPLVSSDLAWRLEPGTDLVVQLHMQPSGAPESVQSSIGFYFSDTPPTRTPTILRLGSQGIDIPPGEPRYIVSDSYVLPVDVELHALQPHAHYRLQEATGTATLPDGTTQSLIRIDRWDFRWQHVYRFEQPIKLPRGTRVSMEYRYDNGANSPTNPQLPPQRVWWGQRSVDEMGDLWFQFVTVTSADRTLLNEQILAKMTTEDIVGYETMLRASPQDAELHDDVAVLYLSMSRPAEAVRHFRASASIKPGEAAAHFNLGTALTMAGQLDEAVSAYRRALDLRPNYASARNNLGSVLAAQGRLAEAIAEFRAAVKADAANVQAHRNLAWHIAADPASSNALRAEAVAAAERAAALTGQRDAQVLETLAAAYRAAGQVEKAAAAEVAARRLRSAR